MRAKTPIALPVDSSQATAKKESHDNLPTADDAARDAAILNVHAEFLNGEALDVFEYQDLSWR